MKRPTLFIFFVVLLVKVSGQSQVQSQVFRAASTKHTFFGTTNFGSNWAVEKDLFTHRTLGSCLTGASSDNIATKLRPSLSLSFSNTSTALSKEKEKLIFPPGNAAFTIINKTNPKKKLKLEKTKVTLFIDESSTGAGGQLYRYNTTECYLDSLRADSITVSLVTEEIDIDYRNKYSNITNTYFGSSFTKVQKTIPLKNIVYLQTRNPLRTALSKGATVLMSAAVVLIVGSPFAGYNQNADAKIAAREHVFVAGMICFGTSVPLFVAARPKKYAISENYLSRKNRYWRIIQNR